MMESSYATTAPGGATEKRLLNLRKDDPNEDSDNDVASLTAASDSDSASASQVEQDTSSNENDHNNDNMNQEEEDDDDNDDDNDKAIDVLVLPTPSPEQEKINTDFCALENMRKANLEMDFGGHWGVAKLMGYRTVSEECLTQFHDCCVVCLQEQKDKQNQQNKKESSSSSSSSASRTSFWQMYVTPSNLAWQKKVSTSCLVCNAPICQKHCCPYYRKIDGISICGHCAPLFTQDFVVDLLKHSTHHNEQKQKLDFMMDCYDRAKLLLRYSAQFMEDIAVALETSKKSNDTIGLGSSSMGILSGVTGVGAVAATAIHVGAIATILTPAGPPLLIASLIFGGAGAAASTSTEAIHHYSEPNQVANKILALHELVHCLLAVTDVIHQAMKLTEEQHLLAVDNNNHDADDDSHNIIMQELLQSKFDAHGRIFRRSSSSSSSNMDVESSSTTKLEVDLDSQEEREETDDDAKAEEKERQTSVDETDVINNDDLPQNDTYSGNHHNSDNDVTNYADIEADKGSNENAKVLPEEDITSNVEDKRNNGETGEDEIEEAPVPINTQKTALAKAMPLAPLLDDVLNAVCKGFMAPNGARAAASSAMKLAQVATVACGALSAAMIVIEGRNMRNSLKSLQAGSPCLKAQMLRKAKEEIDLLPETHDIAAECERYLKAKPVVGVLQNDNNMQNQ